MRKYGQPFGHPRESTNKFELAGDVLIITTQKGGTILADAEDYPILKDHSWCISKTGYAVANFRGKVVKMHRLIMQADDPDIVVDHKNNNKLDNRKQNLRKCTQAENARNKSGKHKYIGIRLTPHGSYNVRITINRKEIHVGNYATIDEAITARCKAEDKYHKEFGHHNF